MNFFKTIIQFTDSFLEFLFKFVATDGSTLKIVILYIYEMHNEKRTTSLKDLKE